MGKNLECEASLQLLLAQLGARYAHLETHLQNRFVVTNLGADYTEVWGIVRKIEVQMGLLLVNPSTTLYVIAIAFTLAKFTRFMQHAG